MERSKIMALAQGPHQLIIWNDLSGKWQDQSNDFFCHAKRDGSGKWAVGARYGFAKDSSGPEEVEFDDQISAMEFFVNLLYARRMDVVDAHYVAIPKLN